MKERWLSVEEIAAHLGINPDTIYKWIDRKNMPAHKVGRLWKFLASEVDQWVKGGRAAQGSNTERSALKQPKRRKSPLKDLER
jgi:excisionase family DNA binding protein